MSTTELKRLFDLPVFSSIQELSEISHISKKTLKSVSRFSRPFYRRYNILKKNGGLREISQPNLEVKAIQAWILRHILDKLKPSSYATAYRKQFSIINNVSVHRKNRYFICLDIKDFFPSISLKSVYYIFNNIGYDRDIALILAHLCTVNGCLPQGGITSPSLSNLVSYRLDRRIAGLVSRKKIAYTRYADDITLSSNNRSRLNSIESFIERLIKEEGFSVNKEKTHYMGPSTKCIVTGLVKNSSKAKFSIGKTKKNHIRSVIFNLIVNKKIIDDKYRKLESIDGLLSFIKMIDSISYNYLFRYYLRLLGNNQKKST